MEFLIRLYRMVAFREGRAGLSVPDAVMAASIFPRIISQRPFGLI